MGGLWYKKKSTIHGSGLFSRRKIAKGTRIIEYVGEKVNKQEGEERAHAQLARAEENDEIGMVYVFELNEQYDIDGDVPENYARFINHSCAPNCEVEVQEDQLWVVATRDIRRYEELLYNYGFSFDENYIDYVCDCGAENCVGYMVAEHDWEKLREYEDSHEV